MSNLAFLATIKSKLKFVNHLRYCSDAHRSRISPAYYLGCYGFAPGPIAICVLLTLACFDAIDARAELGPCITAAPTTSNVAVFVSDLERSVDWYRSNIGLTEVSRPDVTERPYPRVTVMARKKVGVTLVSSSRSRPSADPQVLCFVLDGPPAPSSGSQPLFLIDPDGISIELPALALP